MASTPVSRAVSASLRGPTPEVSEGARGALASHEIRPLSGSSVASLAGRSRGPGASSGHGPAAAALEDGSTRASRVALRRVGGVARTVELCKRTQYSYGKRFTEKVEMTDERKEAIQGVFNAIIRGVSEKQARELTADQRLDQAKPGTIEINLMNGHLRYEDRTGKVHEFIIDANDGSDLAEALKTGMRHARQAYSPFATRKTPNFNGTVGDLNGISHPFKRDAHDSLKSLPRDPTGFFNHHLETMLEGKSPAQRKKILKMMVRSQRVKHKAMHFVDSRITQVKGFIKEAKERGDEVEDLERRLAQLQQLKKNMSDSDSFALFTSFAKFPDGVTRSERDRARIEGFQRDMRLQFRATVSEDKYADIDRGTQDYVGDIVSLATTNPLDNMAIAARLSSTGEPKHTSFEHEVLARVVREQAAGHDGHTVALGYAGNILEDGDAEAFAAYVTLSADELRELDTAIDGLEVGEGQLTSNFFGARITNRLNSTALQTLISLTNAPDAFEPITRGGVDPVLRDEPPTGGSGGAGGRPQHGRSSTAGGRRGALGGSSSGSDTSTSGVAGAGRTRPSSIGSRSPLTHPGSLTPSDEDSRPLARGLDAMGAAAGSRAPRERRVWPSLARLRQRRDAIDLEIARLQGATTAAASNPTRLDQLLAHRRRLSRFINQRTRVRGSSPSPRVSSPSSGSTSH